MSETIVIFYLDASCLLRRLIGDGPILADWGTWDAALSSEIARVEVHRTLDRVLREGRLSRSSLLDAERAFSRLEAGVRWIAVAPEVIAFAAGPMPRAVKALDAIHLGTAVTVRGAATVEPVFATHDRRLAAVAVELGFSVSGV